MVEVKNITIKCLDCGNKQETPNGPVPGQEQFTAEEIIDSGIEHKILKCPKCKSQNLKVIKV